MSNVLLLTYAFQPDNTPAAARPSQLFRYLPEFGVMPFVFASSAEGGINPERTVWRVPHHDEPVVNVAASLGARAFMRFAAPYNDRLPWVPFAASAAARLIRTRKIDAIYSTSPFLASHFAALWLKRRFKLPWIADFQDPVCDNPFRSRRWFYPYDSIIERRVFAEADRLIVNTDVIAAVLKARYPARGDAISVLWNSFDPAEPVERTSPDARGHRVLAHIGTLYGGRHPGQLLGSLKRLGIGADRLRVRLIGPIDDAVLSTHGAMFAEMGEVLEVSNTLVPREEALRETAEADCLLLLDVNERNTAFQVPSKLLDYIRIGRPVLAYTPSSSPVDRILRQSGIAYVAIAPDMSAAESDARLNAFLALPLGAREPSPWFFQNFSARTQARTVADLFREIAPAPAPRVAHRPKPADDLPRIVTTVDAEEAFDWEKPLSRDFRDVTSMGEQHVLHRVFDRFGVVPTYFVTYPVVADPLGFEFLVACHKAGKCHIGAQLHPWVTPPFEEVVNAYNSFAGNLPEALERAKLKTLTDAIASRFGVRPLAYRAGRYGIGPNTVTALAALGYRVDSSIVPEFSYHATGGPTFFGRPARPYWLDAQAGVLELPLTSTYVGRLVGERWRHRANGLFEDDARHHLVRALMARSGMMERIRLTPEGTRVSDAKRLVRALLNRGTRTFTLSYHTPSLVPGNTPYVRSRADRERFIGWLEEFYEFFLGEVGGRPATVSDIYESARAARREAAPALP